jgi:hypothetical protein
LDFVILSIFDHVFFVDGDEGGQKFSTIPNHDRVIDIRAELELVLNILSSGR